MKIPFSTVFVLHVYDVQSVRSNWQYLTGGSVEYLQSLLEETKTSLSSV